jgi:tryptophan-rich sensory protein
MCGSSAMLGITMLGALSLPLRNPGAWALATCLVAALLEGILSGTQVKSRFAELQLPEFALPLWAWSIVGGAYYILFFYLLRSLLNRPLTPNCTPAALALTGTMLIANASWNWIFFRRKDLWLSFVFFAPYAFVALALAMVLHRLRSPLLWWYVLYLGYLGYATWWGYRVWRLNMHSRPVGQHLEQ